MLMGLLPHARGKMQEKSIKLQLHAAGKAILLLQVTGAKGNILLHSGQRGIYAWNLKG